MITASAALAHTDTAQSRSLSWQQQMRLAVRSLDELLAEVRLEPADFDQLPLPEPDFPLLVPRGFVARMRAGDPRDPLLLQVLPGAAELLDQPGFVKDPVGDGAAEVVPGLLHKYPGRALLICTGACAIHCRYCFRRHFPYQESLAARDDWAPAVAAIAADPSIHELLLSGGDPLSLSTAKLSSLTDKLATVGHLRRLRIHSRWPVVLPARVDSPLLDWIAALPWPVTMVIHANHAQEIDREVIAACKRLRQAGVILLNQSVLLAGVNDNCHALQALSERLHDAGAIPYYLHLLDPVAGAGHFAVDEAQARILIDQLRSSLPGYLVPRLAREVAGATAKQVLA